MISEKGIHLSSGQLYAINLNQKTRCLYGHFYYTLCELIAKMNNN